MKRPSVAYELQNQQARLAALSATWINALMVLAHELLKKEE